MWDRAWVGDGPGQDISVEPSQHWSDGLASNVRYVSDNPMRCFLEGAFDGFLFEASCLNPEPTFRLFRGRYGCGRFQRRSPVIQKLKLLRLPVHKQERGRITGDSAIEWMLRQIKSTRRGGWCLHFVPFLRLTCGVWCDVSRLSEYHTPCSLPSMAPNSPLLFLPLVGLRLRPPTSNIHVILPLLASMVRGGACVEGTCGQR